MGKANLHIEWRIRPFFRRWYQGEYIFLMLWRREWRAVGILLARLIWSLWPICWTLIEESPGFRSEDFYPTANDAAIAMAKRYRQQPTMEVSYA